MLILLLVYAHLWDGRSIGDEEITPYRGCKLLMASVGSNGGDQCAALRDGDHQPLAVHNYSSARGHVNGDAVTTCYMTLQRWLWFTTCNNGCCREWCDYGGICGYLFIYRPTYRGGSCVRNVCCACSDVARKLRFHNWRQVRRTYVEIDRQVIADKTPLQI